MTGAALAGIRVVELGQMVAAPYCAKLLADYGADVVKVEPRGSGDRARHWGPFPDDVAHIEKSGLFHFLNTGKRSVALDVGTAADRERFVALVAGADVLVEGNSPAWMRSVGLDYATLAEVNPDLVMISITPFGQDGPYADWTGYDLNAFHLSAAGHRYCGRRGEAPLEHGTFSADFYGATVAAAWGLAATVGRETAGGGQHLDVSVSEAVAATFVGGQNIGGLAQDGRFDRRTGVGMGLNAPAAIMPCKDGFVWMIVLETGQWRGLREAMGDPEWAQLDMFDDMYVRGENKDLIYPLVESWTMQHTKTEIMERCQAAGCPITAVFTVAEALEHPHLRDRGYVVELDHSELGRFRDLGAPFHLPACPGGPARAAPLLGEHDDIVAGDAGWDPGSPRTPLRISGRGAATSDVSVKPAPLDGVRVANFGWVWAGPMVGQTLAFLGADVYKVESRARIDMARTIPPFAEGVRDPNRCLSQHAGWAGNGSVTLNLRSAEGIELARRFVSECDVVIENFGPGVMDKLGLGYDVLSEDNPGLVMFSMPAAGLTGPLSGLRTYGLSLASLTGLDSITGYAGEGPLAMENAYCDPFNGIMGAYSIVVALRHRENSGEGQHIDYSQQEAVMQMVGPAVMDYVLNGRVAGPLGNRHPLAMAAPHGVFPCAGDDNWIAIACTTDDEWQALVAAMGDPAWAQAPELADLASRGAGIEDLHARIGEWTAAFDHRDLAADLQAAGVAATPVLSVGELLEDPQYRHRETFVTLEHPLGFESTIYGAYVKTSRSDARVRLGPVLGCDNDFVFRELLGIPEQRYEELVAGEVIY
ncbi:MAG: CoA transferase [Acidimicrobiia bacterium]|nr:CoA transferase [Acidimicrobiia bacterium]